jgi:hypothetical protein
MIPCLAYGRASETERQSVNDEGHKTSRVGLRYSPSLPEMVRIRSYRADLNNPLRVEKQSAVNIRTLFTENPVDHSAMIQTPLLPFCGMNH